MNWHDTPQQAMEDYLDALLHEDLLEEPSIEPLKTPSESQASRLADAFSGGGFNEEPREESLQARQLSESMLQFRQVQQSPAENQGLPLKLDEPFTNSQVILPNISLPTAEPIADPLVETLADVIQEIETAQALKSQIETLEEQAVDEPETQLESLVEEQQLEEAVKEQIAEEQLEEQLAEEAFEEAEAFEAAEAQVEEELQEWPEELQEEYTHEVAPLVEQTTENAAKETLEEAVEAVAGQPPSPPGWKDGRPVWAQERFECLLFKVKGLTLAVPLAELGGIIKIEKQPTPLFGQPDWFLGILRNNKMNVSMVDTAQWVLPPALIKKDQEPYKLVIRIHNSAWGLACDAVDRSISLQPEQVRWRTSLGKRPWLAGTVIEYMCALIDAAAFDRLLKEGHGDLEPADLKALKKLNN